MCDDVEVTLCYVDGVLSAVLGDGGELSVEGLRELSSQLLGLCDRVGEGV